MRFVWDQNLARADRGLMSIRLVQQMNQFQNSRKFVRKKTYVMFMTSQPVKPLVAERLMNQLKTRLDPLETLMKDKRENRAQNKTAYKGSPFFVQYVKEFWGLSTEGKAVEYTRRAEKETIASGKGRSKYAGIDYMWKA
jgi:hypothetical protein